MIKAHDLVKIMNKNMKEGNGLFSKMKEENVSEETIVRVFGDLIIAAGDTVSPYFSFDAENNKIKPYF